MKEAFTAWFQALDADFFYADLQTLVSRETKFTSVVTTSRSDVCHPLPTYRVCIDVRMKCLSSWYLLRYFLCLFVQYFWNISLVLTFLALSFAVPNFLKLHGTAYLSVCVCVVFFFFIFYFFIYVWGWHLSGFTHWSVLHVLFTFRQSRNYGSSTLKHFCVLRTNNM